MITLTGSGFAQPSGGGPGQNVAALLQRGQLAVFVTLILLTAVAWGFTVIQAQSMPEGMTVGVDPAGADDAMNAMGGMTAMPERDEPVSPGVADMAGTGWSLAGLTAFVVVWAVMMVAMMLPAVAPVILLYRTIVGKQQADGVAFVSTWILVVGYVLVWTAVGAGVYTLVHLAGAIAGRLGATETQPWGPLVLGAILVVAGLYQFTPLKHVCLGQCQSPFGFIMGHWRDGRWGALRMGVAHGLFCVGCCWALFAVLVAAGVMSLAWMLLLTLVVFAEKVLPLGRRTAQGVGTALLVLGVLVASGTLIMPGIV
jgi:predicted metal-binding membrane protein